MNLFDVALYQYGVHLLGLRLILPKYKIILLSNKGPHTMRSKKMRLAHPMIFILFILRAITLGDNEQYDNIRKLNTIFNLHAYHDFGL